MNIFNINPNIYNIEAIAEDNLGNEYKIKIPQGYMTITQEFTSYGTSSCSVDISGSTVSAERVDKENEMTSEDIHYFVAAKYPKPGTIRSEYNDNSKIYFYEITERDYHRIRIGTVFFIAEDVSCKSIGCNPYYLVSSKKREDPHMGTPLRAEYVFSCLAINIPNSIGQETWYKITDISISGNTIDASVLDYNTIEYDRLSNCYLIWNGERAEEIKTLNEVINKFKKPLVSSFEISPDKARHIAITTEEAMKDKNIEFVNEKNKEENNMDMKKIMGDFKFGKVENTSVIKYSFKGIAFKTKDGTYNVYNEDDTLTNVSDMVLDIPTFAIPVSKKKLVKGDIILHPSDRTPLVVKENAQTAIIAVDPITNEVKTFAPKKSVFGFDFYTKITTPMDMLGGAAATEDEPFGNMLPFLMFGDGEVDVSTLLMFNMMNRKDKKGINKLDPLTLMMMSDKKSGDKFDPLMLMMLMGDNPFEKENKDDKE